MRMPVKHKRNWPSKASVDAFTIGNIDRKFHPRIVALATAAGVSQGQIVERAIATYERMIGICEP
jgi:hypothetical protein